MKNRKKRTLSTLQRGRLIKITLVLISLAALWLVFAPKMGVVALYKQNERLQALETQRKTLEKENAALRQEIERINNDIEYLEHLARKKHGLIKENEMIFDFSQDDNKKRSN